MNPYEPPQDETLHLVTTLRPVWAFAGMFLSFTIAAYCLFVFIIGLGSELDSYLKARQDPGFAARHEFATGLLIIIAGGGVGAFSVMAGRLSLQRDPRRALRCWGSASLIALVALFIGVTIATIQEPETAQQTPSQVLGLLHWRGGG